LGTPKAFLFCDLIAEQERLFFVDMVEVGLLVEVTGGAHERKGTEGIVTAILEHNMVLLQPVDGTTLEPNGEPYLINAGLLTEQPSQTEIRKYKVEFRADHIAKLKKPSTKQIGHIRTFKVNKSRRGRNEGGT
jgi:hypothetical protein